jgi:hypothetical protein
VERRGIATIAKGLDIAGCDRQALRNRDTVIGEGVDLFQQPPSGVAMGGWRGETMDLLPSRCREPEAHKDRRSGQPGLVITRADPGA